MLPNWDKVLHADGKPHSGDTDGDQLNYELRVRLFDIEKNQTTLSVTPLKPEDEADVTIRKHDVLYVVCTSMSVTTQCPKACNMMNDLHKRDSLDE